MVGFKDNVASRKPLGKRHKPGGQWDNKPQVLEDNMPGDDDKTESEARISPMRKIIKAARELSREESHDGQMPDRGSEMIENESLDDKKDRPGADAVSTEKAKAHKAKAREPVSRVSDKEAAAPEEKQADIKESLAVREYLHNFNNSLTEMKQKLIMSQNDIEIISREISDYQSFIESEEERNKKLYELHSFLSNQMEESEVSVQTEDVLKNEIESNKTLIKELKDEHDKLETELKDLESQLGSSQLMLKEKLQALKKIELHQKSQKELREMEKRELMLIIEENKRIEDSIFSLRIEHKKEHQKNTTLKSRSDQMKQTLNDLNDIMSINKQGG